MAFVVDRILDEQEVLVKALGPQLVQVRNVLGVTVIGSGKVVPILNVVEPAEFRCHQTHARQTRRADAGDGVAKKAVLIAEDSITSRMLLKNVLEAAGYYVRPTVDGLDALSALGRGGVRPGGERHRDAPHGRHRAHQADHAATRGWPASRWCW